MGTGGVLNNYGGLFGGANNDLEMYIWSNLLRRASSSLEESFHNQEEERRWLESLSRMFAPRVKSIINDMDCNNVRWEEGGMEREKKEEEEKWEQRNIYPSRKGYEEK